MKDLLRPNEMDGVGDFAKVRAIGFAEWIESSNYPYIGSLKGFFHWNHAEKFLTTEELYKEYLKHLENAQD